MATEKKISELTALAGASVDTAADLIPIVDTSATTTKSITPDALGVIPGVKKFICRIGEAIGAPVSAAPMKNTLGGTPVWSYQDVGCYVLTLASAFTVGKTTVVVSGGIDGEQTPYQIIWDPSTLTANALTFYMFKAGVQSDAATDQTVSFALDITVYP